MHVAEPGVQTQPRLRQQRVLPPRGRHLQLPPPPGGGVSPRLARAEGMLSGSLRQVGFSMCPIERILIDPD